MGGLAPIDAAALAILGIAALRGLAIGLVRESLSLASIAVAYVAVVLYVDRLAAWIGRETNGEVGELVAPWVAGVAIVVIGVAATAIVGRIAKRGARLAGLGWVDRAGGALLGSAEGLLVVGILLSLASTVLGSEHPALASSRSLGALERLQRVAQGGAWQLPDVAAGRGS